MVGNAPDIDVSNVAMTFLLSDCFIGAGMHTDPDVSRAAPGRPEREGMTWSPPARRTGCGNSSGLTIIWAGLFTGCA